LKLDEIDNENVILRETNLVTEAENVQWRYGNFG